MSESSGQQTAFIFHGTGGHPKENWFPWLTEKMQEHNIEVITPQFPTPENQSLQTWLEVLAPHQYRFDQNTIAIGHSLGGLFLLRVLERLEHPIKASFFVAAPVLVKPIKFYEADEKFAAGLEFDWETIRTNAGSARVFHSDNDPFVSLGNGEELARQLGIELNFVPNAGHFNESAGYTKFDQLWEEIKKVLD